MPKTPEDVLRTLTTRLTKLWTAAATGQEVDWNPRITLAPPESSELNRDFSAHLPWVHRWNQWAQEHSLDLVTRTRNVAGSEQFIPQAVIVPDLKTAARLVGDGWPERLARGSELATHLAERFASVRDPRILSVLVREVTDWTDLDIDLLIAAGDWFTVRDGAGRTPRQIHIDGMQAKWLNTSQHLVRMLSGREDLGLAPPHPPRVHFSYLDPDHRAAGGRRYDCHSLGDINTLPYPVRAVIICENKDTVVAFPEVPGGIAIEGNGSGPGAIPELDWVRRAPVVTYWGDLDADGLEILSQFRDSGIVHQSLLMDQATYQQWGKYGTNHDRKGRRLTGRVPKPGLSLDETERSVYEMVCDPGFTGFRRLEQERISLTTAHAHLSALLGQ